MQSIKKGFWSLLTSVYMGVLLYGSLIAPSAIKYIKTDWLHTPAYALLMFLMYKSIGSFQSVIKNASLDVNKIIAIAFIISIVYGGLLEILQGFVGRTPSWLDIGLNIFGAGIMVFVIFYREGEKSLSYFLKESDIKRIKHALFYSIVAYYWLIQMMRDFFRRVSPQNIRMSKIGFLVEEFFHEELRGFGGFGMTVKLVADYFNSRDNSFKIEVYLTNMLNHETPTIKQYHNTDVLFRSCLKTDYLKNFLKYCRMANKRNPRLLVTIDWYNSYLYTALAFPKTPILIWIKEPRGINEWKRIQTVPLELEVQGSSYKGDEIERIITNKRNSLHRLLRLSKIFKRKIIFATEARFLVERARGSFEIPDLDPILLRKPIELPNTVFRGPHFSQKPSVTLLGRLEPIKRPWIYFELAKRLPHIEFLVAGITHFPKVMNPIIEKYKDVPNLRFLGLVTGKDKEDLLNNTWALVNTSVSEGLPCTFMEAFSYGKTVISCVNPDDLVQKYGRFVGEKLGDAMDEAFLTDFAKAIGEMVVNEEERVEKGIAARKYLEENHTFEKFRQSLENIIDRYC